MHPALLAFLAPVGKVLGGLAVSLLTEAMLKHLVYRSLKALVEKYRSRAYESPGLEDDKNAEFLMGVLKDVKKAWQIDE
jgi:hypothetical protein